MSVTKTFPYVVGNACSGTGVDNLLGDVQFFFPNPVQNILHIQLPDDNNRVVVMDMMCRKVFDRVVPSTFNMDMSTYETGIYFIRVENKQGVMNGKVIKR